MKIIKTTFVTVALSLISTSAFAGNGANASTAHFAPTTVASNHTVHVVKPAVLLDANPYAAKTAKRRIVRVLHEAIETPVARDASMSTDSQFVYKYGKNTNTKTFRPAAPKSTGMPNLFKK